MSRRKGPTLKAKLAACIRDLLQIPYEHAKLMTEEQVLSLVQWQHIHYWSQNQDQAWVDEHWNIEPLTIMAHREITAKKDIPQIAKTKRIARANEDFVRLIATPRDERPQKRSRWGSRPFQKRRKTR